MKEHKEDLIKIIVSGVLLAAFMLVTKLFSFPWWVEVLMFVVPYLIVGGEVLLEAGENIVHGEIFDECFLMCVATIGAFAVGEYPEAVFVMLFFSIGELFEHIATDRSKKSITALMDIRPDSANLETENGIITVSPEEVKQGDIIVVKPGEKIPLDGIVEEGVSSINTTALTGESLPTDVAAGDKVISGCVNISGVLRVSVTDVYAESTAAKILKLVESSAESKAKPESFIKRFAHWYTPTVVILAVLLCVIPSLIVGNFTQWFYRALMFLVVSCPCALVVSIPLSYFSGIGGASKKGILIKGAGALENISKVKTVVFDKTGTLTVGSFFVTAVHPNETDSEELIYFAAAAESYSDHPISRSIRSACKKQIDPSDVTDVEEIAGHGVKAVIGGKHIAVGNDKLMKKDNVEYRNCHRVGTIVHVAVDGRYAGHIVISDKIKPDSKNAVEALKAHGVKTVMLTGDLEAAAKQAAEEIGVDKYYASLLPADKVTHLEKIISEEKGTEKTAFVGDGINDAPVLARADIGIAMGSLGSDAAIEAADMVIMDDKLSKIPLAVKISEKTNGIVWQNIIFSLAVKFAVLALSALGLTNMWAASFADVGVLVVAILNSTRAMKQPK